MKKIVGDTRLLVKVCSLYYEESLTQMEIANILQISRPTVSRLLNEAREKGIVKIEIINPLDSNFSLLERELEKKFGIKEVIIVEDRSDSKGLKEELGKAAAGYLQRTLKKGDIVGVSMGTTIKAVSSCVELGNEVDAMFVPLLGGIGQTGLDIHANQIVLNFARTFKGDYRLLHAPAVISEVSIKENLQREKSINEIMKIIHRANVALLGIGVPTNKISTMMATGYFGESFMEKLRKQNAVGDICLQFYDINGEHDKYENNENVFGVNLENIKKIETRIGVAGGEEKIQAIIGALNGNYINVLVTNYSCASKISEFKR